jgi:hypothetical protein
MTFCAAERPNRLADHGHPSSSRPRSRQEQDTTRPQPGSPAPTGARHDQGGRRSGRTLASPYRPSSWSCSHRTTTRRADRAPARTRHPIIVLNAYTRAAALAPQVVPRAKGMRWAILVGIGKIESYHLAGRHIDPDGTVRPPFLGPRLDGSGVGGNTTRSTTPTTAATKATPSTTAPSDSCNSSPAPGTPEAAQAPARGGGKKQRWTGAWLPAFGEPSVRSVGGLFGGEGFAGG